MRTVRPRTPNYLRFIVTGAILGFVAGALLAVSTDSAPDYSAGSQIGYFGILFAGIGAVLAGVVAILLERRP